jgi:hypothetical protein
MPPQGTHELILRHAGAAGNAQHARFLDELREARLIRSITLGKRSRGFTSTLLGAAASTSVLVFGRRSRT